MRKRHFLNYYVDRDGSIADDLCYLETYEYEKPLEGKLIHSEPIEIEDLKFLSVTIDIFFGKIKRYKGKYVLKKKALQEFRKENPGYITI